MPSYLELLAAKMRPQLNYTPVNQEQAAIQEIIREPATQPEIPKEAGQTAGINPDMMPDNIQPSGAVVQPLQISIFEKLLAQQQARQAKEAQNRKRLEDYLRTGIEEQESAVKAPQERRVDLSPLLALSDTWFGGNLQKGYQRPPTQEEIRQLGISNLAALQQRKEQLADFAAKGVGTGDDYTKLALALQKDQGTQGRYDEKRVSELSSRIEKSGLSDLDPVIANLQKVVPQEGDVAGVGQTALAPDFLISQEGKDVRQAVASLRNIILKARSGGAVTPQEADRMLEEIGTGPGKNDDQLRRGLVNVSNQLASRKQNILAGYTKETQGEFASRGGNLALPSLKFKASAETGWSDQKEKRLQELRAKAKK